MRIHRFSLPILIVVLASLWGCAGKSASSKFYVLSALAPSGFSGEGGAKIGVFPIVMPDYLDRQQIVTRVSENEIRFHEFNRWAEPLKDNVYRVLVENLSLLLGTEKIVSAYQEFRDPVDFSIQVEILRFDGTLGGEAVLSVKWGLYGQKGKELLMAKSSSFREPTGAPTYEALVAAESRAVAALSREIAEAVGMR